MNEEAQRSRTLVVPRTRGISLDLASVMEQAEAAGRAVGEPVPRAADVPTIGPGGALLNPAGTPRFAAAVPTERRAARADASVARVEQRMTVHIPDSLVLATKKAALDAGVSLSAFVARALEVATAAKP